MADEENKQSKEEKGVHAKGASLWAQIIAAAWVAVWNGAQFVRDLIQGNALDTSAIIYSGVGIAACFSPVFFNMLMDKIKDIKQA